MTIGHILIGLATFAVAALTLPLLFAFAVGWLAHRAGSRSLWWGRAAIVAGLLVAVLAGLAAGEPRPMCDRPAWPTYLSPS